MPRASEAPVAESPWRVLLSFQDRHQYLRMLEPATSGDATFPEHLVTDTDAPSEAEVDEKGTDEKDTGDTSESAADVAESSIDEADAPNEASAESPHDTEVPDDAETTEDVEGPDDADSHDEHRDQDEDQDEDPPAQIPGSLDLDAAMARADHHLLRSPAAMTRTATNFPDPADVEDYLAHSADLTFRAGSTSALATPLAACALAEHYVFRRIGGASAGAAVAAAVAAAELGRTTPPNAPEGPGSAHFPYVQPGFAGLADAAGWLAGQDVAGAAMADNADLNTADGSWPEQYRLARMFQPSRGTRDLYRAAIALTRGSGRPGRDRVISLLAALLAASTGWARAAAVAVWLGAALASAGLTVAFARSGWISAPVLALTSITLFITFAIAAASVTTLLAVLSARSLLRERADVECYGLVPGITMPDMTSRGAITAKLDDLAGVLSAGQVPAVTAWLADRIDDLAGMPPGADDEDPAPGSGQPRRALTFGELWLGRLGAVTPEERDRVERACRDREHRVIDLALTTTNVSQGRPYTLPFVTAEQAESGQGSRFLFCRSCLGSVLPLRVVAQMVLDSPAQASESTCPRHDGELLRDLPEPWDLPVVVAARMSMAAPGLLRAVPLYTLDVESPGALRDPFGRMVAAPPMPPSAFVPRVQWFVDGGVTRSMPVSFFDEFLPRWPTFSLAVEQLPTAPMVGDRHRLAEWIAAPEQDATPMARSWRRISGWPSFAAALGSSSVSWRDTMAADLPGLRGRIAMVRQGPEESGHQLFVPQRVVLQLLLRGGHAGMLLRERFSGQDGDIAEQTQTDRHRWIRLRMALREYRELSLSISARLPLYSDLAATYRVPKVLTEWFTPPISAGSLDPAWPDAAASVTHLRALSAGGVLDWDTDYGAPPVDVEVRIAPAE